MRGWEDVRRLVVVVAVLRDEVFLRIDPPLESDIAILDPSQVDSLINILTWAVHTARGFASTATARKEKRRGRPGTANRPGPPARHGWRFGWPGRERGTRGIGGRCAAHTSLPPSRKLKRTFPGGEAVSAKLENVAIRARRERRALPVYW